MSISAANFKTRVATTEDVRTFESSHASNASGGSRPSSPPDVLGESAGMLDFSGSPRRSRAVNISATEASESFDYPHRYVPPRFRCRERVHLHSASSASPDLSDTRHALW